MKLNIFGYVSSTKKKAFEKAWNNACNGSSRTGSIHVPAGKAFLVNSLHFTGPCLPKPLLFTVNPFLYHFILYNLTRIYESQLQIIK